MDAAFTSLEQHGSGIHVVRNRFDPGLTFRPG